MADGIENIPEICIRGERSKERPVNLRSTGPKALRERGALVAGISDLYPPYRVERSELHDRHRVNFTLGGKARLEAPGLESTLAAGDVIVMPARAQHRYWVPRRWQCMWIQFSEESWLQFLAGRKVRVQRARALDHLHEVIERIVEFASINDRASRTMLESYGDIAMELLARELADDMSPARVRAAVAMQSVLEGVRREPSAGWSMESLGECANTSPAQLYRYSVEIHGVAPMELVFRIRMRQAEALLVGTDYGLAEIATRLGYETPFSFSRAFKRHAGVSPRAFRRG